MSSKRNLRKKQCAGKQAHNTLHEASMHAFSLGLRYYSAYRCRWCHKFHVGRIPDRLMAPIKKHIKHRIS